MCFQLQILACIISELEFTMNWSKTHTIYRKNNENKINKIKVLNSIKLHNSGKVQV